MASRQKGKNFSLKEEEDLMRLVKKYWEIIECKITDHVNNLKKKNCWDSIEREYNSIVYEGKTYRTADALKNKYENICRRAKAKRVKSLNSARKTGGGPPETGEDFKNTVDETILSLLGSRAIGFQSTNDNDCGIQGADIEVVCLGTEELQDEDDPPPVVEPIDNSPIVEDWSKYTPAMLRKPRNELLKPKLPCHDIPNSSKVGVSVSLSDTTNNKEKVLPSQVASRSTTKRKMFDDKLATWAKQQVQLTKLQEERVKSEVEGKKELLEIRIAKERNIAELQQQEIKERMRMNLEKHNADMEKHKAEMEQHKAEMELIALKKHRLMNDM